MYLWKKFIDMIKGSSGEPLQEGYNPPPDKIVIPKKAPVGKPTKEEVMKNVSKNIDEFFKKNKDKYEGKKLNKDIKKDIEESFMNMKKGCSLEECGITVECKRDEDDERGFICVQLIIQKELQ